MSRRTFDSRGLVRAVLLLVLSFALVGGCGDSANSPCKTDADCGKPTCDQEGQTCSEAGLECQLDLGICGISLSSKTPGVCNATTGRCEDPPKCKADVDCGAPTCKDTPIECQETRPACNTGSGKCLTSKRQVSPAKCDAATGRCVTPSSCRVDADCGSPGCVDRATECVEAVPTCHQATAKCGVSRRGLAGKSCSSSTGRCV